MERLDAGAGRRPHPRLHRHRVDRPRRARRRVLPRRADEPARPRHRRRRAHRRSACGCSAPTGPGYGGSSPNPGRTMADHVADVVALLDHLGVDRFAVVGTSTGGPYAVAAAALHPARVDAGARSSPASPTSAGTAPGTATSRPRQRSCASPTRTLPSGGSPSSSAPTAAGSSPSEMPEVEVATMAAADRRGDALFGVGHRGVRAGRRRLRPRHLAAGPAVDRSTSAPSPRRCACTTATLDALVPLAHAEHTASIVPGAELVVWPGIGPHGRRGCVPRGRGRPAPLMDELLPGVLAELAAQPGHGAANAAVVVDDDGVTVVDTLMVPSQWEPFGAAVDALGMPGAAGRADVVERRVRRRHGPLPAGRHLRPAAGVDPPRPARRPRAVPAPAPRASPTSSTTSSAPGRSATSSTPRCSSRRRWRSCR